MTRALLILSALYALSACSAFPWIEVAKVAEEVEIASEALEKAKNEE